MLTQTKQTKITKACQIIQQMFTCLVANAFPPNMAALAELIGIRYEKKFMKEKERKQMIES